MDGKLEAIWIKRAKRGPMDAAENGRLVEGRGLEGSADQGGWRQVTIIEREVFDQLRLDLDPCVEPAMRRANLMVSGVRLAGTRGQMLRVGGCAIEVRGETRPCERMDQACPGLREGLSPEWRGGVFGVVVRGGDLNVGDAVTLEPARPRAGDASRAVA